MKFITSFRKDYNFSDSWEYLVSPLKLSISGEFSFEEVIQIFKSHPDKALILNWDILHDNSALSSSIEYFQNLLKQVEIRTVRVRDLGAANFMRNKFSHIDLEIILDNSFHNIASIKSLQESFNGKIRKFSVSSQLPSTCLEELNHGHISIEILFLGDVLMFYSPRHLLTNLKMEEALISSPEGDLKDIQVRSNEHGTFFYHRYPRSLIDFFDELKLLDIDLRIESFKYRDLPCLFDKFQKGESGIAAIQEHLGGSIPGFFRKNKTTTLFKKLKNKRIDKVDSTYLGQVLEVKKGEYIAVQLDSNKNSLSLNDQVKVSSPEGTVKIFKISKLQNTSGEDLKTAENGIFLINHVNAVSVRSILDIA